jgi:hypothetical protein
MRNYLGKSLIVSSVLTILAFFPARPIVAAWSFETMREHLATWHGHSIDQVIEQWGFPSDEKTIVGRQLVYWRFEGPEVTAVYGSSNWAVGNKRKHGCTITFEINKHRQIVGTKFDGTRDYCGKALRKKSRPFDVQEAELEKQARRKAAEEAGIAYVEVEGCELKTPNRRKAPISKIAIFPFGTDDGSCQGIIRPGNEEIVSTLRGVIQSNDSLKITYSYDGKSSDDPVRDRMDELWEGSVSGKPNTRLVFRLAQKKGVDAVLMSWRPAVGFGYCTNRMSPFPITFYLIDVESQCTLSVQGNEKHVKELTEGIFAHYLKGPGKPERAAANKR